MGIWLKALPCSCGKSYPSYIEGQGRIGGGETGGSKAFNPQGDIHLITRGSQHAVARFLDEGHTG
jgi:hypothetical protein